jgi:hypothetical protein
MCSLSLKFWEPQPPGTHSACPGFYRDWFTFCFPHLYNATSSDCSVLAVLSGKRPLGRPRRRWEDNIRMDLQEVGCECEDWIGLAQDRDTWRALVSAVKNLRVP